MSWSAMFKIFQIYDIYQNADPVLWFDLGISISKMVWFVLDELIDTVPTFIAYVRVKCVLDY